MPEDLLRWDLDVYAEAAFASLRLHLCSGRNGQAWCSWAANAIDRGTFLVADVRVSAQTRRASIEDMVLAVAEIFEVRWPPDLDINEGSRNLPSYSLTVLLPAEWGSRAAEEAVQRCRPMLLSRGLMVGILHPDSTLKPLTPGPGGFPFRVEHPFLTVRWVVPSDDTFVAVNPELSELLERWMSYSGERKRLMNSELVMLADAVERRHVGGKAASLGKLIRAGFSIPLGVVVPTAAFREHIQRAFAGLPEKCTLSEKSAAIRNTPLNEKVASAVRDAWSAHIETVGVVRSSATHEDSSVASFAGQFHTALNVTEPDQMQHELLECWASLFSEHAGSYIATKIGENSPQEMAVVIQNMVQPELAGVAFSLEPSTGSEDVSYVEWIKGSGERLVQGTGISGRAWLDRKGHPLRIDHLTDEPAPDIAVWRSLSRILRDVVNVFGVQQDVEWAWTGDRVMVLQARPITVEASGGARRVPEPWVFPGRPPHGWTGEQRRLFDTWDEYNPRVVLPLDFDLYMAAVWRSTLEMLGAGERASVDRVVVCVDKVPLAIDPAARVQDTSALQAVGGSKRRDLAQVMEEWRAKAKSLEKRARHVKGFSSKQVLALLDDAAAAYREALATRLLSMNTWIAGEQDAKSTLLSILGPLGVDGEKAIECLASGVDHDTARMNQGIQQLVLRARHEGKTERWRREFDRFVTEFGYFEYGGALLLNAQDAINKNIDRALETRVSQDLVAEARQQAESLENDLLAKVAVAADRARFAEATREIRRWVALRENSKMRQHLVRPTLEAVIQELGERLKACGVITANQDIRLFTYHELRAAFDGEALDRDQLARRSELVSWKASESWLPIGFVGEKCDPGASILRGLPAGPGTAIGPARVVGTPSDFPNVGEGDIVVAYATNPVWTQLFSRAAGIVVENGSRISHAAITAREYGIPAVVGIAGLIDAIQDDERLQVDGDTGEIRRLDRLD